jgi:hypothetical protein
MTPALASLLTHPAIWRGGDCAPEPAALPTGFAALDAVLPGGGWPGNALTEIMLAREGIGEMRLALPALAALTRAGREVIWIAPPHHPHAPALVASGIVLSRLAIVRCRTPQEAVWAFDQALRAPECGAAFAWLSERDERALRRLAIAAREGRTFGVLWRRPGVRAQAAAAPLRLLLSAQDNALAVTVLKRRGGEVAQPIVVDLAARWSLAPAQAFVHSVRPTGSAPGLPPRPSAPARRDPRTSEGRTEAARLPVRRTGAVN